MKSQKVSVRYCSGYDDVDTVLGEVLADLGGIEHYIEPGQRVLIKPNLIAPKGVEVPAQTHPALIAAMVRKVLERGANVVVGDSPAWSTTEKCLKVLGIYETLRDMGVEIASFKRGKRIGLAEGSVHIATEALEADVIINLPKMKAHQQLGATIAVKNMYGCVTGKEKAYWHFRRGKSYERFCGLVMEIYDRLAPVLTVVDAVQSMQGPGPIRGERFDSHYLVGGISPIACEVVLCHLLKIDAGALPIHAAWKQSGRPYWDLDEIEVAGGNGFPDALEGFVRPNQIPLHFSFSHICKSLARQGWLKMKAMLSR